MFLDFQVLSYLTVAWAFVVAFTAGGDVHDATADVVVVVIWLPVALTLVYCIWPHKKHEQSENDDAAHVSELASARDIGKDETVTTATVLEAAFRPGVGEPSRSSYVAEPDEFGSGDETTGMDFGEDTVSERKAAVAGATPVAPPPSWAGELGNDELPDMMVSDEQDNPDASVCLASDCMALDEEKEFNDFVNVDIVPVEQVRLVDGQDNNEEGASCFASDCTEGLHYSYFSAEV